MPPKKRNKSTAANAGKKNDDEKDDTEMDPAEEEADAEDTKEIQPARAAAKSSKKRSRKDVSDEETSLQHENKSKRSRMLSPPPAAKKGAKDDSKMPAAESEEEDGDGELSEEGDAEMAEKEDEKKEAAAPKADASDNEEEEKNGNEVESKKPPAKKAGGRKKAPPPAQKLRLPSHQTPGKFAQNDDLPLDTAPNDELPVPTRRLVFNAAPPASSATAAASSSAATTTQKNLGQAKIKVNGTANTAGGQQAPETDAEEQPPEPSASRDYPTQALFWFLIFFLLQGALYPFVQGSVLPKIVETSTVMLHSYKRAYYTVVPLPTKKVLNQTFVDELKMEELKRQQAKRDMLKDMQDMQKSMQKEIQEMEHEANDVTDDLDDLEQKIKDHQEPVEKLHDKLLRIDKLLQGAADDNIKDTMNALTAIRKALGEKDENKLLDLSSLDLWEIPEMPEACNEGETDDIGEDSEDSVSADSSDYNEASTVVDKDRLEEWLEELQELVNTSTGEILKDDSISKQVRTWVRSEIKKDVDWEKALAKFTVEEVSKLIKKEMNKGNSVAGSLDADAIVQQIQERLEVEIADQTGRYDFASIRNGAAVIGEGPRATSHSLVQDLPVVNRLLAHTGMRFYGHGAEAALTPTDPPDALGQCWSFQSEEGLTKKRRKSRAAQDFSRGSVATLAVRLARPAYVHSIVIEHPPKEITDRVQSAIRVFRVVGYEDAVAQKGSYELGRFEYKIGKTCCCAVQLKDVVFIAGY